MNFSAFKSNSHGQPLRLASLMQVPLQTQPASQGSRALLGLGTPGTAGQDAPKPTLVSCSSFSTKCPCMNRAVAAKTATVRASGMTPGARKSSLCPASEEVTRKAGTSSSVRCRGLKRSWLQIERGHWLDVPTAARGSEGVYSRTRPRPPPPSLVCHRPRPLP